LPIYARVQATHILFQIGKAPVGIGLGGGDARRRAAGDLRIGIGVGREEGRGSGSGDLRVGVSLVGGAVAGDLRVGVGSVDLAGTPGIRERLAACEVWRSNPSFQAFPEFPATS
jgi:hypothetical protein